MDKSNKPTNDPNKILADKAFLNTFADGNFGTKVFT